MKRDIDLIRNILEVLEAQEPDFTCSITNVKELKPLRRPAGLEEVTEHLALMFEAGLLVGLPPQPMAFVIYRISWKGHDFLDSTRNPTVWAKTKERALKAGGWTFDLLLETAREELKRRILGIVTD